MNTPDERWMATLLAEDGQDIRAGLPEEMRQDLDQLNAAKNRTERAKEKRERMTQLLASITEHEARIEELQQELRVVMREYAEAMLGPQNVPA